jgi:hypothetical protein
MSLVTSVGADNRDRRLIGHVANPRVDDAAAVTLRHDARVGSGTCVNDGGRGVNAIADRIGLRVVAAADEQGEKRNERESCECFHTSIVLRSATCRQLEST